VPAGQAQYRELQLQGSQAQLAAQAAAYARTWDDSVVLDSFGWQQSSTVTCCMCRGQSHSFGTAQELMAAIPDHLGELTVQVGGLEALRAAGACLSVLRFAATVTATEPLSDSQLLVCPATRACFIYHLAWFVVCSYRLLSSVGDDLHVRAACGLNGCYMQQNTRAEAVQF
jgi:hypothetical protein